MTLALRRTTSADPMFASLTAALDGELRARYGAIQDAYDHFNQLDIATVIVAYDGELPVGCGCFKRLDATTAELKRVFVIAGQRGHGIAGAILAALEAWIRELGYTHIALETGRRQPEAVALYQRHGYAIVECFGPYAGMSESVCMRKALGDPAPPA